MTEPPQPAGTTELERILRVAARTFGAAEARFVPSSGAAVAWGREDNAAEAPAVSVPVEGASASLGTLHLVGVHALSLDEQDLLADFAGLLGHAVERGHEREAAARMLREREALLRQVVDHLPVVIYMADRDGWFSISEGRGLTGLKDRPSAVGKNMYERYRDAPQVLEPLKRTLAGEPQRFMNELQGVIYEDRTAPLRDEEGEVVGLVGVSVDVTEREERARALAASEARLRSVVENTPVILFVLGRDGRVLVSEGRGLDAIGLRPGEVVGAAVFELYEAYPDVGKNVRAALSGEAVGWTVEIGGVHLDTRLMPVRNGSGEVEEVIGVSYDVTERVGAEAALREAARRAEEASRMKSAFLANMSHEIRTPLTSILGFAELLADDVPPEHSDVPGLIMQGGHRLMDTLNSVLDLARIEAEQMDLRLVPADLADEVGATVRLLRPLAERKGLRLGFRRAPLPGPVLADRAALARVVNNLVGNAIKFTSEGGVLVEVGAEGDAAVLRVRDSGEGIADAFVEHLFDPFRQESDGLERRHEGSGLGLAITRRLVELMGGRIGVESRKGEGSTFTVQLPMRGVPAGAGVVTPSGTAD